MLGPLPEGTGRPKTATQRQRLKTPLKSMLLPHQTTPRTPPKTRRVKLMLEPLPQPPEGQRDWLILDPEELPSPPPSRRLLSPLPSPPQLLSPLWKQEAAPRILTVPPQEQTEATPRAMMVYNPWQGSWRPSPWTSETPALST